MSSLEAANERFEEEVKVLLSGYLASDPDTVDYLALKIARLHDSYTKLAIGEVIHQQFEGKTI